MGVERIDRAVLDYADAEVKEFETREELFEEGELRIYRNFSPWGHRPTTFEKYVRARSYCQVTGEILSALESTEKCKVLDAGCGIGSQALLLAYLGLDVMGIDLVKERIELAQKRVGFYSKNRGCRLNVGFLGGDLFKLMKEKVFDVIWVREAVSHIHPVETFFSLAFRSLNPGGILVVSDANWSHPAIRWELYKEYWKTYRPLSKLGESTIYYVSQQYKDPNSGETVAMAMERVFSLRRLRAKIEEAGFQILTAKTIGHLPKSTIAEIFTRKAEKQLRLFDSLCRVEAFIGSLPVFRAMGMNNFVIAKKALSKKKQVISP